MPICMLKTYDTDWEKLSMYRWNTTNFAIFCLFKGNKSGLFIAILKFIKLEWDFYLNRHVFMAWFRLEKEHFIQRGNDDKFAKYCYFKGNNP